jgi:hypothetical protein
MSEHTPSLVADMLFSAEVLHAARQLLRDRDDRKPLMDMTDAELWSLAVGALHARAKDPAQRLALSLLIGKAPVREDDVPAPEPMPSTEAH